VTTQQADRRLPDPVEPTISVGRAAAILGVSERAVYYAIRSRECPRLTSADASSCRLLDSCADRDWTRTRRCDRRRDRNPRLLDAGQHG
jgi:hypothetical protein